MTNLETFTCPTCGLDRPVTQRVIAEGLRSSVIDRLKQDHPEWDRLWTCRADVHRARVRLLGEALKEERGEMGTLDQAVLKKMAEREVIARNLGDASLGPRVADAVARFGGSWAFLGIFGGVIVLWMVTNAVLLAQAFDPYPFILLNLVLSCLAAVQAPIIMMSQNRHGEKDRERAEHDYEVNLKAELEVQLLHEKLDHLMLEDNQRLLRVLEIQTEMLQELTDRVSRQDG